MAKRLDTFEKYLEDQCYNDIFKKLKSYIIINRSRLNLSSNMVANPVFIELDNFHVMGVTFNETEDEKILFRAAVEADINISGKGGRDYEQDMVNPWFSISLTGVLHDGLNSVEITGVSEYSKEKFRAEGALTKHLVPIIYKDQLDGLAESFLKRFYPEALTKPMALPVQAVVQRMGLALQQAHLSKNCTVFGQILFTDCQAQVYNSEKEAYQTISVQAGTIFYDPMVFFMRSIGSAHNTIIHECVHWYLHRKTMELVRLYDHSANTIRCQVGESSRKDSIKTPLDWMEWQANALAPRILMPADPFRILADKYIKDLKEQQNADKTSDIIDMVIQDLSNFFQVSKQAAKIRLIDLGFEEAAGALSYVDDRYITNYAFKPGAIRKNQTYDIPLQDALIEYTTNPELHKQVDSGGFIYVDAHFCINDPKYIQTSDGGEVALTEYALGHLDECCLVFDVHFRRQARLGSTELRDYMLFKQAVSDSIPDIKYSPGSQNQDVVNRAARYIAFAEEVKQIMQIKDNPKMQKLMQLKYRGCSDKSDKAADRL